MVQLHLWVLQGIWSRPTGLEKICLEEHNPYWYPISEVDIELSQTKIPS